MRLTRPAVRAAQRPLLAVLAVPRGRPQRGLAGLPLPRPELMRRWPSPVRRATRTVAVSGRPVASRRSLPPSSTVLHGGSGHGRATSSAAAPATRCSAARPPTGTWPPTRAPDDLVALLPGAVYENRFGTVAVRRDERRVRDHDLPLRARLRGLPAAAPRRVRGRGGARPRAGGTSRSTRSPGAGRPASRRHHIVDPFDGLADLDRRACSARWATPTPGSARTRCA